MPNLLILKGIREYLQGLADTAMSNIACMAFLEQVKEMDLTIKLLEELGVE